MGKRRDSECRRVEEGIVMVRDGVTLETRATVRAIDGTMSARRATQEKQTSSWN